MKRLAILALALSAPAYAKTAETRSGLSNSDFINTTPAALAAKFAEACLARNWVIVSPSAPQVECEDREYARLKENVAALTAGFGGGGRGSTFRSVVRFTLVQSGDLVRVQAGLFTEQASAFGRVSQWPAETTRQIDDILWNAGDHPPPPQPLGDD